MNETIDSISSDGAGEREKTLSEGIFKFPHEFLWGTATSAHQIEGDNTNSNWWEWEQNKPPERPWPKEPSNNACDSYNRYEEDFELCRQMNNNAVRFSVEWARIEPEEGVFDTNQIDHYKKVIKSAKSKGLKTYVTLHHFTEPLWMTRKRGWTNSKSAKWFARYAEKCAEEFGELADAFLTINEPQVLIGMSYLRPTWPPAFMDPVAALSVHISMMRAHRKAYKLMKEKSPTPVGIVKNINWFETSEKSIWIDKLITKFAFYLNCDFVLRKLKNHMDLIGVNYYFTNRFEKAKWKNPNDYLSDLDWWINPPGLENILRHLKKYNLPIYITENGLADANDKFRSKFIHDHLLSIWKAIQEGVQVNGYFHWSLLDNYEWHQGFWPRFGLVEIDRENNLERKPRKSFYYYADICKNNEVIGKTYELS